MKFKRIYIEITNSCNLNCSFCSKDIRSKKTMNVKEFEHIINEIKPHTNMVYFHIKGEPLLNNNILEFLNICAENNIMVKITTNGMLLKKYYLDFIKYNNLKQINISLHSEHNQKNYNFEIFDIAEKLSPKTTIIYRIWNLNQMEFNDKSLSIIEDIKKYYNLDDNFNKTLKMKKNVYIKDNIYIDKDDVFEWPNLECQDMTETGKCYGTVTHVGVLVDGTVIPCCLDGNGIVKLGNIFKDKFIDIIEGERFKKIRHGMKTNTMAEELCKKCKYRRKFEKKSK